MTSALLEKAWQQPLSSAGTSHDTTDGTGRRARACAERGSSLGEPKRHVDSDLSSHLYMFLLNWLKNYPQHEI